MQRPKIVYLDEPVKIGGINVKYSYEGCKYLIEHWSAILEITDDKRTDKAHVRKLIEQWEQYVQLYEQHNAK